MCYWSFQYLSYQEWAQCNTFSCSLEISVRWQIDGMFLKGLDIEGTLIDRRALSVWAWISCGLPGAGFVWKTWHMCPFYLLLWASHLSLSELGSLSPNKGLIALPYEFPFHGHSRIWMRSLSIRLKQLLRDHGKRRQLSSLAQWRVGSMSLSACSDTSHL